MELINRQIIEAPRPVVWAAINDPETLGRCIPGCEHIARLESGEMEAIVSLKVGPVKARFKGKVVFEDVVESERLTLAGQGSGGIAGHARGTANVVLEEEGAATALSYTVKAAVGGKIAQLGARLIDSTAQKLAREFFGKLEQEISNADARLT